MTRPKRQKDSRNTNPRILRLYIFGLLICLLIFLTSYANAEYSGEFWGLTWSISDEGVLTISGEVEMHAFPDSAWLLYKTEIKKIVICDGVKSIGGGAFYGCSKATEVSIPDSVTQIGGWGFTDCSSLQEVDIPDTVTMIDNYAFQGCSNLTQVFIPDNVTFVGYKVFLFCPAKAYANYDSSGAKAISKAGFSFKDSRQNFWLKYLFEEEEITGLEILDVDKDVENFTLPDFVSHIGNDAFSNCNLLQNVVLHDGIKSIGDNAFINCSSLLTINIPDSVQYFGSHAFSGCSSLQAITIPYGIETLKYDVFANCSSLKSIDIPSSVTTMERGPFYGCSGLTSLVIPDSVTSIGEWAFGHCYNLRSISIPDTVETIGEGAFQDCNYLENLTLPANLISLSNRLLENCSKLKSIDIPGNVVSIGRDFVYGCSSLKSVTIPASVTTIDAFAFYWCGGISKIFFLHGPDDPLNQDSYCISKSTTIYCYEYSNAEDWFTSQSYNVELLNNVNLDTIRTISLRDDFKLALEETFQLVPVIYPDFDRPKVSWTTSDPAIATVDNGIVTPHAKGNVTITATVSGVLDEVTITVYQPATSFEFSQTDVWIVAKDEIDLNVIDVQPAAADALFSWSSSNDLYATVDSDGMVTTKKPGTVIISVDTENGIHRECQLTICYRVSQIAFEHSNAMISPDEDYCAQVIVTMEDQTNTVNHLVVFESSHPEVATVDDHGIVHGKQKGITTITATADSVEPSEMIIIVRSSELILPSDTKRIEDYAFEGCACEVAIIPENCNYIGTRAFADCKNLILVVLHSSDIQIADDAFTGCSDYLTFISEQENDS